MVTLIERDVSGIFNAAAPRVSWDRVLHELSPLSQQSVRVVRPPAPVIEELKLEFPLVEPTIGPGIFSNERMSFDGSRARKVGLSYRSYTDTGRATLEWWRAQTPERRAAVKHWPTAEQEADVLNHLAKT
jgi:hypothetical protein